MSSPLTIPEEKLKPSKTKRVIGRLNNDHGPTMIFTGGVHGNEPSGVIALEQVFEELKGVPVNGTIIGLRGNLTALEKKVRYLDKDLNRLWSDQVIEEVTAEENDKFDIHEKRDVLEIWNLFRDEIGKGKGPYYFMDLHTTSCETTPFLTVNDSLLNRKFTRRYPVPMVLGIEEHLEGPVLSYINQLGYVAFGFEAGQHDAQLSIHNHKAFIYLSLYFAGIIDDTEVDLERYYRQLRQEDTGHKIYEIVRHRKLRGHDRFTMLPGFSNFQIIKKNEAIAHFNDELERSDVDGRIFMPLYQKVGDDGYFVVKKVKRIFLKLSAFVRKLRLFKLIRWLPGVKTTAKADVFLVDLKIARFYARDIFHLFGFRITQINDTFITITNREIGSRYSDYRKESWY